MSRKLLTSLFAVCACAAVAAQDQAQPASRTQAPATTTTTTAPPAQGAAKAITIEGCVARSATATATTGAVGTTGAASAATAFILEKAAKPAAASSTDTASSNVIAPTYRLDADESKLTPHVGHKVEVTGTVEAAMPSSTGAASASTGAAMAPKFKVDSVKMLAATCP